jgi:hypothetical protein
MTKKISYFLQVLLGIASLSVLISINYTYPLTLGKTSILYSDYGKFYHSQQLLLTGKNIYSPIYFIKNKQHSESGHALLAKAETKPKQAVRLAGNLNPPFFTLLSFPLAYLPYSQALLVWTSLSMLAGCFAILLIQQKLEPHAIYSLPSGLLLLSAFLSYFPSFAALQFGQVSLLLLPLIVLGWRATYDRKPIKAAIFLGLAASLKPFFALFLLYFLIRKEWRALWTFSFTLVVCAYLALAVFGMKTYYAYYQACQQIAWAASSWNVSFYGLLLRLIGGPETNTPLIPIPGLFTFAYLFLSAILILVLVWFLRPTANIDPRKKTCLDFSIILVAMLLLSPLGWMYYFPFLSIPFLILWDFSKKGIYPISLSLAIATLLLLSNIPVTLTPTNEIKTHNALSVFYSASLYFFVLLGLLALLLLIRQFLVKKLSLSFEKIPSKLLLLVVIVAFLPSLVGMAKSSNNWIRYTINYSSEYSLIPYQD